MTDTNDSMDSAESQGWYEPVSILKQCSLSEALVWVWHKKLPKEFAEFHNGSALFFLDCESLDLPPVPEGAYDNAHLFTPAYLRRSSAYQLLRTDAEKRGFIQRRI